MAKTTAHASAFFFGEPGRRLFGWVHPPAAARSRGHGVVVCNPIGDDVTRAHRPLRHLAEQLAAEGFWVMRFDFHGTGDSDGDERDPARVETWVGDVARAAEELRRRSDLDPKQIAIVGLRLGGTLAVAAAARGLEVDEIVLWAPYDSGAEFVADVTQVHRTHAQLEPSSFSGGPAASGGREALGFFLSDATIRDLERLRPEVIRERPARAALVIATRNLPAESVLANHLARLGVDVSSAHIPGQKFLISAPHTARLPIEILDRIVAWLSARHPVLGEAPRVGAAHASPRRPTDHSDPAEGELPLAFGPSERLFGVLHRPLSGVSRAELPAIIMLNAGCVHRTGAHRLYVRLARRWAALGFDVLRMDLSGIGDSPASDGCPENLTYPRDGLDDVGAAMDRVQSITQARDFVVLGLCSGADIAFQLGLRGERVRGVMMLNPRTFCVHALGAVDGHYNALWYRDSIRRIASWKKLLRGDVDAARVLRIIAPRLKSFVGARLEGLARFFPSLAHHAGAEPAEHDVARSLRRMVERGVDTYLLVADPDPGVHYVDAKHGPAMRDLRALRGYRRTDVAGTDHTFTALWAQAKVGDLLTEHLVTRHGRGLQAERAA